MPKLFIEKIQMHSLDINSKNHKEIKETLFEAYMIALKSDASEVVLTMMDKEIVFRSPLTKFI